MSAATKYCPNFEHENAEPNSVYLGAVASNDAHGYVAVYACTICGLVFGLDRSMHFCPVPDDFMRVAS